MGTAVKKNISVIPPKPEHDRSVRPQLKALRVAAYCRVSTLQEQQETSYEAQVAITPGKSKTTPTGSWREYLQMTEKVPLQRRSAATSKL